MRKSVVAMRQSVVAPQEDDKEEAPKPSSTPPKELTPEQRKATLKEVRKEGGTVGVDLEGANRMGNTQFFCSGVSKPNGDLEFLMESVKAMNAPASKVVRAHQAHLGGAAHLGKMITTSNNDQVAVAAFVPKELQSSLKPLDWLQEVMDWYGGEVTQQGEELCLGVVKDLSGNAAGYEILIRHNSTDILQRHKLMAQDAHHHDDEIFGDEDMPGISEERRKSIFAARKSVTARKSVVA